MKLFSFGYFPQLQPRALFLLGLLFGFGSICSFYFLFKPKERLLSVRTQVLGIFFTFWILGLLSNGFTIAGFEIYPMGNAIDAMLCILFSSYLHRSNQVFFKGQPLLWLAEILTSLSFGALFGLVFNMLIPRVSEGVSIITSVVFALGALSFLQYLKCPGLSEQKILEIPYLSPQELRICQLIAQGYRKKEMLVFLNITDGTFRNHLASIYSKTIEKGRAPDPLAKDKLQQLTIYLQKI